MSVTVAGTGDDVQDAEPAAEPVTIEDLGRRLRRLQVMLTATALVLLLGAIAAGIALWGQGRAPAQTSAEVGFARDMYVHHGQAVTMGLLLRNRAPEPLNTLSEEIITGQAEQQGILLGWLSTHRVLAADESWQPMQWMERSSDSAVPTHESGHPTSTSGPAAGPVPGAAETALPGMASDTELTQLAELRGAPREVLFLRLMLRHHRAGTDMAEVYLDRGNDDQLRELAHSIVTSQEREIRIMTDLLATRDAQP